MRNCPGIPERAGKPPALGSQTPGVVTRKLRVVRNIPTARALPTTDARGENGRAAMRIAMATSTTPSTAEKPRTLMKPVDPTHQRAVGDVRTDPLGLVRRELHEADPPHHDHQAVAGQLAADRLHPRTQRTLSVDSAVCSCVRFGDQWPRRAVELPVAMVCLLLC